MRLGYSTWGMPRVSIQQAILRLAAIGYDGIELTALPGYSTALETLAAAARAKIRGLLGEQELELPAIAAYSSLLATEVNEHETN